MSKTEREKLIRVLKVLLTIDDPEIIKATIESIIESLEDANNTKMD